MQVDFTDQRLKELLRWTRVAVGDESVYVYKVRDGRGMGGRTANMSGVDLRFQLSRQRVIFGALSAISTLCVGRRRAAWRVGTGPVTCDVPWFRTT